jgi:hypothetical protein
MGIRTKRFSLDQIYSIYNYIVGAVGSDAYYVFAGKPMPWPDDATPPAVFESMQDSVFDTQKSLLFGKKIGPQNLRMMVDRYSWSPNQVYDYYTNTDIKLYDKKFFVLTDENKCYKILYNGQGKPSTVKPTLTQNSAFTTSDGYLWKYMFSVDPVEMTNFATPTYFPVGSNANTVGSAHTGIDVVELLSSGTGYLCYVNGTIQALLTSSIIQIDDYASEDNDFYTRSAFYVTNGPGAGELRQITKYVSNTTGNFAYMNKPLAVVPQLSKFRISPYLKIVGDGTGAVAVCDVNENYALANVQVVATGNGYSRASVVVQSNTSYGVGASLQAYIPPPGGHGSNPSYELGADTFGVNIIFNGTENGTIPVDSSYRRYGVMMNPMTFANNKVQFTGNTFSNVMEITTSPALSFKVGETVSSNDSITQAYVIASNTTVTKLVGEKTFEVNQQIVAANGISTGIASINTPGDIDPTTPNILYINNSTPIPRSASKNETIKLLFTI